MILMFLSVGRSTRSVLTSLCVGLCAAALLLTACGSQRTSWSSRGDRLEIVAAFYPLQFVAARIAGPHAHVVNLTKPGAEPHDLELTPRAVATLAEADLAVYLRGFQPAVDDAIDQGADDHGVDVSGLADLTRASLPADHGADQEAGHGAESVDENVDGAGDEAGAARDPHFWLDPLRLARVADGIARRLAHVDPDHARAYERNAAKLRSDLKALDRDFAERLAGCRDRALVTSHAAFGYLARRYQLHQVGLTGLSPEQEPSPATLAKAAAFVRRHDVHTIYYETLVSPALARTLAGETGADVGVLDPVEGLTDRSAGTDYLGVMRSNLTALAKGQDCP